MWILVLKGNDNLAATHSFSKGEELANSITHGIGAILSIVALVLLIIFGSIKGSELHIVSFGIFGITMLFLYISSTLVHSLRQGKAKDIFEILDHSAIYFLLRGRIHLIYLSLSKDGKGGRYLESYGV